MTAATTAGHSAKHVSSKKHAGTSKHSPTAGKSTAKKKTAKVSTKAKHAKHAKARGFSPSAEWLPVCSLEAVAQSLRLAGQPVADDEVAWLWELCGSRELSIPEALAAAARFGLAGRRSRAAELVVAAAPVGTFPLVPLDLESASVDGPVAVVGGTELDPVAAAAPREHALYGQAGLGGVPAGALFGENLAGHALILGVDVPGPHAVLATPDGWWSWGKLHDPWAATVEEAWAVSWS